MRSRLAHFAPARSLFRIHYVGRGCAPFSLAHSFVAQSMEDGGDNGVAVLRFAPRPRPAACVFVSPLYSLFIVHSCRSKREAAAFLVFPLVSCLASLNHPPRCPFASFASPIPSRLIISFSSRSVLPDVLYGLPPILRSCRFVQLVSPFSPCLAVPVIS